MSDNSMGWVKKRIKHDDGRVGCISREYCGFCHVTLTLTVEGQESPEYVQLNSDATDSGATGWKWLYSRPEDPEAWGHLGDHNEQGKGV